MEKFTQRVALCVWGETCTFFYFPDALPRPRLLYFIFLTLKKSVICAAGLLSMSW